MNTTLSAPVSRTAEQQVRRVGLFDRMALHLGVALITWGRRPQRPGSSERRALRHEQLLVRAYAEQRRRTERERAKTRFYELRGRM